MRRPRYHLRELILKSDGDVPHIHFPVLIPRFFLIRYQSICTYFYHNSYIINGYILKLESFHYLELKGKEFLPFLIKKKNNVFYNKLKKYMKHYCAEFLSLLSKEEYGSWEITEAIRIITKCITYLSIFTMLSLT